MWSTEYLDRFDTSSQKTADSWADDYLEQMKHTQQNLTPQTDFDFKNIYETEWDSIRNDGNAEDFLAMPFEHYKFVEVFENFVQIRESF